MKLPVIPAGLSSDLRQWLTIAAGILNGLTDSRSMGRAVTAQELIKSGIAGTTPGGSQLYQPTAKPVLTKPPKITGLDAQGAFALIMLHFDNPDYYANYSHAEVWRADVNDVGQAVLIGTTQTQFYNDAIGTGADKWYWVRAVSKEGVKGDFSDPANGQTSPDVAFMLELLKNKITESQLYKDLGERIALIDAPEDIINSVSQRVKGVRDYLMGLLTEETSQRVAAVDHIERVQVSDREATAQSIDRVYSAIREGDQVQAAALENERTVRATKDEATAQELTTLQTTVNGHTTSIQQQMTSIDGLGAQYTLKIDNNGYVSGFGLASTAKNGTPESNFTVRADIFAIASPSGPGVPPRQPFYVVTTPIQENGTTIQPGVYMDTAFIKDASIQSAKIGSLTADKIRTGTLQASEGIEVAGRIWSGISEFSNPQGFGGFWMGRLPNGKVGFLLQTSDGRFLRFDGNDFQLNVSATSSQTIAAQALTANRTYGDVVSSRSYLEPSDLTGSIDTANYLDFLCRAGVHASRIATVNVTTYIGENKHQVSTVDIPQNIKPFNHPVAGEHRRFPTAAVGFRIKAAVSGGFVHAIWIMRGDTKLMQVHPRGNDERFHSRAMGFEYVKIMERDESNSDTITYRPIYSYRYEIDISCSSDQGALGYQEGAAPLYALMEYEVPPPGTDPAESVIFDVQLVKYPRDRIGDSPDM